MKPSPLSKIASNASWGVIEGACRHFVKDRMEQADMRWMIEGAQAMLDLRNVALNGDWNGFTQYRIQRETERL